MSSSGFVAPAHYDLVPGGMSFTLNAAETLGKFLPELAIEQIHKAEGQPQTSLCGHYKIKTKSGALFFAKVKAFDKAQREDVASELSTRLFHQGARAIPLHSSSQALGPDGMRIFVYPWVDGMFFDESDVQTETLGRELAALHNALHKLSRSGVKRKNILDIWKEQLGLTAYTSFAPEYAARLRVAEKVFSRSEGYLAHNDLHRANVLFARDGGVAAFIDFEDSAGVNSSILVDLSAVIERFCLLPDSSRKRVSLLLTNYLNQLDRDVELRASDIVQIGICRCFHSLSILNASPAYGNPGWMSEVAKFEILIKRWQNWEPLLLSTIP